MNLVQYIFNTPNVMQYCIIYKSGCQSYVRYWLSQLLLEEIGMPCQIVASLS